MNQNIIKVLREFINNLSNKRRLDNAFYIELIFIEIFMKKMKMKIMEYIDRQLKIQE